MTFLRQHAFTIGDIYRRGDESFRIDALNMSASHITLIGTSGEVIDHSLEDFRDNLSKGVFKKANAPLLMSTREEHDPPIGADDEELDGLRSRVALVRTIEGFRKRNMPWRTIVRALRTDGFMVDGERQECELSERRIKQLFGDWQKFGDWALRSYVHRRGNRKQRYDTEFERAANLVIDAYYTKSENISVESAAKSAADKYREKCVIDGVTPGACGRKAFEHVLAQRSDFEILSARLDPRMARRLKRSAIRQFTDCNPLDRIEIDSTPIDVYVVDEEGEVLGRATVCAAIDVATGVILAANVTMAGANKYLVLQTLKDAMLRKDDSFFENHGIRSRCNPFGVPAEIDCDRGSENKANIVENFLLRLGLLDPSHKPGKPEKRPHIERSWRAINEFLSELPGGVNQRLAGDDGHVKRAMDRAGLTLPEIETIVQTWIHDIYHQSPLDRLSKRFRRPTTPAQAWERLSHTVACLEPPTVDSLREASLLSYDDRTVQHYGIDFLGERYHCEELTELYRVHRNGLKVDVYIDPMDMRTVEVLSKDRRTRCTARIRWDMPPLNLDQFKAFLKRVKPSHTNRDKVALARYELVSKAHAEVEARQPTRKKRKVAAVREEAIDTIKRSQLPPDIHGAQPETPVPGPGKIMRPGEDEE